MGLPVLATNWSGPTAYLDESVGYPIEYRLTAVADELRLDRHRWAEPSKVGDACIDTRTCMCTHACAPWAFVFAHVYTESVHGKIMRAYPTRLTR